MSVEVPAQLTDGQPSAVRKRWYQDLTVQVAIAALLGVALGHWAPAVGVMLQPIGDTFIKLIKMVVGPIAFLTIVSGIATVGDLRRVGRIGGLALLYFEVLTTVALVIGMIVADLLRPGDGLMRNDLIAGVDISQYKSSGGSADYLQHFLTNLVPDSVVGAFARGDLLQIVCFAILFGCSAALLGERARPFNDLAHATSAILFKLIAIIMRIAPLGALGAIAYTVGKFGVGAVLVMGKVLACVYGTSIFFVLVVLNGLCRLYGFSMIRFLRFVGAEIMIVVGTAASESVFPQLIAKLTRLGCSAPAASLVLPTGYSFNADGASIYLSIAALFIAQAYGIQLDLSQQIGILLLLMLTSKGAAGVGGAGFIVLAATLSATHALPVEGLALLVGVDRFMTQARATTNIIGNAIATVIVSKAAREFDHAKADAAYAEVFGPGMRFKLESRT
jgi:aerobic C4-dicarboxylate transport protein